MWRMSSSDGTRWVQWDAGQVSAAPAELYGVVTDDQPVEVAVMSGEFYTPRGPHDEVAVFLRARNRVGGGARVSGQPPRVPSAGPASSGGPAGLVS